MNSSCLSFSKPLKQIKTIKAIKTGQNLKGVKIGLKDMSENYAQR
jgi:hypothetical protein